jgi:hypothetical protein
VVLRLRRPQSRREAFPRTQKPLRTDPAAAGRRGDAHRYSVPHWCQPVRAGPPSANFQVLKTTRTAVRQCPVIGEHILALASL